MALLQTAFYDDDSREPLHDVQLDMSGIMRQVTQASKHDLNELYDYCNRQQASFGKLMRKIEVVRGEYIR